MSKFIDKIKDNMKINKERNELIKEFSLIMAHTGTYNLKGDTFEIADEQYTNYGWRFKLFCSRGLTYEKLNSLTPFIKDGLKCAYFMFEIHESNKFAICDVIYNEKLTINRKPYEPYPVKPYELYFGNSVNGKPIIVDINKSPMSMISGETGSGKNGSLNHCLISLIHNCTSKDIQILYYQGDKGDGCFYNLCDQTYAYAESDLNKLNIMLKYILNEESRRKKLFEDMIKNFKGDNLYHYNKLHPNKKLPYIFLVIDEFLSCTVKSSDSKATKELKNSIIDNLESMAQRTRAYGMVYIISHQKPEKALCPSFMKNMSSNRICFGFSDPICSEIVLGNRDAYGLPDRRAIFQTRGRKELLFTTDLTGKIEEYLSPHVNTNRADLFEDLKKKNEKINKNNEFIKDLIKNGNKNIEICDNSNKKDKNYCEKAVKIATKEDYIKSKLEGKVNKKPNDTHKTKKDAKLEAIIKAIKNNPNYVAYNEQEQEIMNMIKLENEKKES